MKGPRIPHSQSLPCPVTEPIKDVSPLTFTLLKIHPQICFTSKYACVLSSLLFKLLAICSTPASEKVTAAPSAQARASPERGFLKKKKKTREWQQFAITDNNLMRQKESGRLQVGEMSHTVGGSVSITEWLNSSICIQLYPSTLLLEHTTQTELV